MQNKSLTIYIDHSNLLRFEELALELANMSDSHFKIEVHINPEKTQAVVNFLLMNVGESKRLFTTGGKLDEFKHLALDFARASNTRIKIDVNINQEKTRAQANIMLLGVNR